MPTRSHTASTSARWCELRKTVWPREAASGRQARNSAPSMDQVRWSVRKGSAAGPLWQVRQSMPPSGGFRSSRCRSDDRPELCRAARDGSRCDRRGRVDHRDSHLLAVVGRASGCCLSESPLACLRACGHGCGGPADGRSRRRRGGVHSQSDYRNEDRDRDRRRRRAREERRRRIRGRRSLRDLRRSPSDSLSAEELQELRRTGRRIERSLGGPQDLEWAFDRQGKLWLLQARPITTISGGAPRCNPGLLSVPAKAHPDASLGACPVATITRVITAEAALRGLLEAVQRMRVQ
jgi:Pyruvate phosphate dikinase, AMP/ATP-binding domain